MAIFIQGNYDRHNYTSKQRDSSYIRMSLQCTCACTDALREPTCVLFVSSEAWICLAWRIDSHFPTHNIITSIFCRLVHLVLACTVRCHSLFVYGWKLNMHAQCWACIISSSLTIYNYCDYLFFCFSAHRLAPILFAKVFIFMEINFAKVV